jgi:hypothetical protein
MAVVSVLVAMAMMVRPRPTIAAMPHHRTLATNETATKTEKEIEFTIQKRMRMERSIPTQASNDDTKSDSDAEIGRKRPPRGPPAGAGAERRHASGEGDHGTAGGGRGGGKTRGSIRMRLRAALGGLNRTLLIEMD